MWIKNNNDIIWNRFPDLPPCSSVPLANCTTTYPPYEEYIISIDVKLWIPPAVNNIVQVVKGILMCLVLVPFRGWPQYDVQWHFADDSENHAVSSLNQTTVSFKRISKNDSKPGVLCQSRWSFSRICVTMTTLCWDCRSVSCECCVLSSRGLCDGLIHHPGEFYRLCVFAFAFGSLSVI